MTAGKGAIMWARVLAGMGIMFVGICVALPGMAMQIAARNAVTGAPVSAELVVSRPDGSAAARFSLSGRHSAIGTGSGPWQARAEAPGFRTLEFQLDGAGSSMTLLLDPVQEPARYRALDVRAARDPDSRWLQGFVRRADDGAGLVGAEIQVDGRHATSGEDGYFELELAFVDAHSASSALRVKAAGFAEYARTGLLAAPGAQRVLVALGGDTPSQAALEVGALDRDPMTGMRTRPVGQDALEQAPALPDVLLALPLAPPPSIRVGYADAACTTSCCTASCNHTCVLPLETYVRRGLDSEWIASWNTQSLRAGSLAYRSYGAWRVAHPINANFDICSSACCQVNDAGTHSSTDAAVARTPGLMLSRNGSEVASTEYSAENNSWDDPNDGLSCSNVDLSCGDGFAGSPSANWPCLADAVGAGHGCFGHGRGMSQWGTQRWAVHASAPHWPWIVDHYYNDNGNASGAGTGLRTAQMTSPLALSNLLVQPSTIEAGEGLLLHAMALNAAGAAHDHLLIGASLYRSGSGNVDDSANDAALSMAPGSQAIARAFETPTALVSGSWDVLVSLYLDVDENGSISATDLPLALIRSNGALRVIDDRIFAHGFEP
jgi:hypothetical protein